MKKLTCLIALTIAMLLPSAAHAADPYFLVTLTLGPGVDFAALTPEQGKALAGHVANLTKMKASGMMLTGGRAGVGAKMTGVAIVTAKDGTTIQAYMDADPAVKADVLRVSVQPFELAFPPDPPCAK